MELRNKILLLVNKLTNLPVPGTFILTIECDGYIFEKIPKISSDLNGFVSLNVTTEIDVEDFGTQRILNNPIIFSLYQHQESRKKEKTKLIEKFIFDAFQIIAEFQTNGYILRSNLSSPQNIELEISTIFEPKNGKSDRRSYNWAKITVEYLVNLPEDETQKYSILAGFRNIISKNKEPIICGKAEVVTNRKPLKWLTKQKLDGNDVFIPNEGRETRKGVIEVENMGPSVAKQLNFPFLFEWNKEHRQMLIGDEFRRLKEIISLCPYMPVELFSCSASKEDWEIDGLSRSHAITFVDLSHLLYPGVTRIRGSYEVKKFSDEMFAEKGYQDSSIVGEVADIINNTKSSSKKLLRKSTAKSTTTSSDGSDCIDFSQFNVSLIVSVELSKPIISRREDKIAIQNVTDVLKGMENETPTLIGVPKFIESFKNGVIGMFTDVFSKVRPPFDKYSTDVDSASLTKSVDDGKSFLNTYLEFQRHIRFPIANEALNMFDQITQTALEDLIQDFLDDLKVHLMQEVRKSLNTLAESQQSSGNEPSIGGLSESDFLCFAEEAEFMGNLQFAKHYIEALFAKYGKTKENLLAAASLFARLGNREEAIVCLKWLLETDPSDVKALICLGVLLAELAKLDEAKHILESASDIEPNNISSWIILGLFYESINDTWNYERTNIMLKQIKNSETDEIADESVSKDTDDTVPEYTSSSDLINTFDLLLQLHANSFIDHGLSRLLLHLQQYRSLFGSTNNGDSMANLRLPEQVPRSTTNYIDYMHDLGAYYRFSARVILQSNDRISRLQKAECEIKTALQVEPDSAENWCLVGLLRCLQMNAKVASESFQMAMQLETWPVQNHHLYRLKLAQCYAAIENYEKSKMQFLKCCQNYSTPESWKGVGIACYRMNELEESKVAFEEANRLNNRDVIPWAYLAMICLKMGKTLEAEECLKIIDKLELTDDAIKTELEQIKLEEGKGAEQ